MAEGAGKFKLKKLKIARSSHLAIWMVPRCLGLEY
jgi:hypothetical protein